MRSTWPSYFENRAVVLVRARCLALPAHAGFTEQFVLDKSNRSQTATAGFELFSMLRSEALVKTPVVIVLSNRLAPRSSSLC
jgi:hypothetical protein